MAASNTPRSMPVEVIGKKNTSGSTISKGMPVKLDTAADDGIAAATAATDHSIGIAMADIPANGWGDIQLRGLAICLAGGTVTRGDYVTANGSSKVITTTTNKDRLLGVANRSAAVNELFEVELAIGTTLSA